MYIICLICNLCVDVTTIIKLELSYAYDYYYSDIILKFRICAHKSIIITRFFNNLNFWVRPKMYLWAFY